MFYITREGGREWGQDRDRDRDRDGDILLPPLSSKWEEEGKSTLKMHMWSIFFLKFTFGTSVTMVSMVPWFDGFDRLYEADLFGLKIGRPICSPNKSVTTYILYCMQDVCNVLIIFVQFVLTISP